MKLPSQQPIQVSIDYDRDSLVKLGYVCAKNSTTLEQLAQTVERAANNNNPYI